MAFQRDGSNNVIAFAEAEDVRNLDQRFFESNEIKFDDSGTAATTLNEYLDILCERATDRITTKMQASPEWNTYTGAMNISSTGILPEVNKNLIIDNLQDWTDMCVFRMCSKNTCILKLLILAIQKAEKSKKSTFMTVSLTNCLQKSWQ